MKQNIIFGLILILVVFGYFKFSQSDEKMIIKTIDEIQMSLEFEKTLTPVNVLNRLKVINKYISPTLEVVAIENGNEQKKKVVTNLENIKAIAIAGARKLKEVDISKYPAIIEVNGDTASAKFEATITIKDLASDQYQELFSVELKLRKVNDLWIIESIKSDRLTPES